MGKLTALLQTHSWIERPIVTTGRGERGGKGNTGEGKGGKAATVKEGSDESVRGVFTM